MFDSLTAHAMAFRTRKSLLDSRRSLNRNVETRASRLQIPATLSSFFSSPLKIRTRADPAVAAAQTSRSQLDRCGEAAVGFRTQREREGNLPPLPPASPAFRPREPAKPSRLAGSRWFSGKTTETKQNKRDSRKGRPQTRRSRFISTLPVHRAGCFRVAPSSTVVSLATTGHNTPAVLPLRRGPLQRRWLYPLSPAANCLYVDAAVVSADPSVFLMNGQE